MYVRFLHAPGDPNMSFPEGQGTQIVVVVQVLGKYMIIGYLDPLGSLQHAPGVLNGLRAQCPGFGLN